MSLGRPSLLSMTPNTTSHSMNAHTKMQTRANVGSFAKRRMWNVWMRWKQGVMRLVFGGSGPPNHRAALRVRAATCAGTLLLIFFQWGASCHGALSASARLFGKVPGKLESEEFISMSTRGSFEGREEYVYGGTPAGSISSTMVGRGRSFLS
jgi:hypothetical protein